MPLPAHPAHPRSTCDFGYCLDSLRGLSLSRIAMLFGALVVAGAIFLGGLHPTLASDFKVRPTRSNAADALLRALSSNAAFSPTRYRSPRDSYRSPRDRSCRSRLPHTWKLREKGRWPQVHLPATCWLTWLAAKATATKRHGARKRRT